MSIYVFITRKADPLDDSGPSISPDEWLEFISNQADFRLPMDAESEWIGKQARIWGAHIHAVAFDYVSGEIWVKQPDAATIARMKRIASLIDAKVFSETGEVFGDDGKHAGFLPGFP